MQFLHVGNSSKNISSCFHRDVKSANIVLKQDLTAQLIDCGLAMFVVDDMENLSSGSRKGTPGYICPEYNAGGIPFDCACDIYSFGVVLVELWTGRLQNHKREDSSLFNFGLQYIPGRKGAKRDIHTDLDPMFGYEPSNDVSIKDLLPSYMLRLVRLALQCMDDHDDIPSGKDVLHELVDILHACTSYEDGTTPPVVNTQNEAPDPPEPQLCDWCKSFPKLPNGVACRLCSDAEQQRSEFLQLRGDIQEALALFCAMGIRTDARLEAIGVETHTRLDQLIADTNTTNTTLNTMAPLLGNLDARISSAIPRLFFMVPATRKMALRHPREYLHSRIATKYYLYFVCEHTKSPVVAAAPIKIHMTKRWVEKVAPALVVSLHLLQCGLSAVGVPLNLDGSAFQLTTAAVDDMLTEVASIVDTMGTHSNLLSNLKGQRPVDGSHVPELSGDVYDHMVEKATEQRDWRQHMEPVRTASNPATLWVCKEIADDPTHGYVKARK